MVNCWNMRSCYRYYCLLLLTQCLYCIYTIPKTLYSQDPSYNIRYALLTTWPWKILGIMTVSCTRIILPHKKEIKIKKGGCIYRDLSFHILLVLWDGNWTIRNKNVGLVGYCLCLCLWRVLIEFWAMILAI